MTLPLGGKRAAFPVTGEQGSTSRGMMDPAQAAPLEPPTGWWSRRKALLGALIGGLALAKALGGLDLAAVGRAAIAADHVWIAPAALCYLGSIVARTWRWKYLLRTVRTVDGRTAFSLLTIGYAINNVLPARVGELARLYLLRVRTGVGFAPGLATLVLERVLDTALLVMIVVVALTSGALSEEAGLIARMAPGLLSFVLVLLVALGMLAGPGRRILSGTGMRRLRFATAPALRFASGLESLSTPRRVLDTAVLTALIWGLEASTYWLIGVGFGLGSRPITLLLTMAVAALATALPSAPGHLGTFDLAAITVLRVSGVQPELAAGYVLVVHGLFWATLTTLGSAMLLMWTSGRQPLWGGHPGGGSR